MQTNYNVTIERQFKDAEKEKYVLNYGEDYGAALNKYLKEAEDTSAILSFTKTVFLQDQNTIYKSFSINSVNNQL